MGKPLMIQMEDELQILRLKEKMGAKTKIDVVRKALNILEDQLRHQEKAERWIRSAKVVKDSGLEVLKEFETKNRFKNLP